MNSLNEDCDITNYLTIKLWYLNATKISLSRFSHAFADYPVLNPDFLYYDNNDRWLEI